MGLPPSHHQAAGSSRVSGSGRGNSGSSQVHHQSKRRLSDYRLDDDGFEEIEPSKKVAKQEGKPKQQQQQINQEQQRKQKHIQLITELIHEAEQERQRHIVEKEKRLRKFRPHAPQNFYSVWERATSQRFFVLGRSRCGLDDCPEEFVELTGSTGNVYLVHIARQPTCTCPHAKKGNQCKHVLYVMSRVLRAPFELTYQLALLSSELRDIFAKAPPISDGSGGSTSRNRKALEGDCPICFCELEDSESTVYCRATCGQNIHRECFQRWAASKQGSAGASSRDKVTCPMCRSPWQEDNNMVKKIRTDGAKISEGYVNVASQLGISRARDSSSYYHGPRRYGGHGWW